MKRWAIGLPSRAAIEPAIRAYNARYGTMDTALWRLSLVARDSLLRGSPIESEALVWMIRSWWGVQGATRDTATIAARSLVQMALPAAMFEESHDSGLDVRPTVERVCELVETMRSQRARRSEMSLASKTLHWLMPWRFPVYDKFVCDALGQSQANPRSAYVSVVGWQYEATDRLLSPDREWLGTTDPKSLLRALDKYLWFYGGGDANVAVVVKNPTGRVSSLLSEIRAREGAGG